jgi:hypothetical protein
VRRGQGKAKPHVLGSPVSRRKSANLGVTVSFGATDNAFVANQFVDPRRVDARRVLPCIADIFTLDAF